MKSSLGEVVIGAIGGKEGGVLEGGGVEERETVERNVEREGVRGSRRRGLRQPSQGGGGNRSRRVQRRHVFGGMCGS
jgi:hypothetical protein